ncbi:aldehyde dehydrogenase [Telmatospirillum sp. J64-1]|uniref:aldehyde dehydrogenase n=1 Tax=Telmatospirillum sp. J64-1 TaxID=2502183 RepID=UPI00163D7AA0|nr:aldehyde dehydrogenase [Telmatospirillum sp. J64-1]
MWVDGKEVLASSGKTFSVQNPKNEEVIAQVAEGDAADVDHAVAVAQRAFQQWGQASAESRGHIMARVAEILRRRLDEFIDIEVEQTGRARREMAAQLARLPEWYDYFGALARTHEDTVPPFGGQFLNYTRRVPLGVVGHITPWNHPLLILTKKVAPSLAAGNTMVVKPSELAPLTPLLLGEVMREAGVPDGVYNVVPGFGAGAGAALTTHPGIRKIDLTGGTETGKTVASLAGRNLTRFAGELGGKASVVTFPDISPRAVVSAVMFASFVATGQTCVQGARLLVHRSIHDEVVNELVTRTQALRLGDPQDLKTQVGPLISERQRAVVEKYVRIGIEEGATLAAGGRRPEGAPYERGYWYLPTIFTDVRNDMRIAQEEIFGPVVCVLPFDDEDEAVALANGTEFGLAASVWTSDVRRAHRVAHQIEAGIVWINDHHRIDPASPWGGFKMSGIGRENGIAAYHDYTQIQNVIVNLSKEPFDWFSDDGEAKRYS